MKERLNITAGKIVSVNTSREKGTPKEPSPEITIDERGVQGDAHAGVWHRQVSLLAIESIERFSAECKRTFKHGEFAENITTRGIDLTTVALLDTLTIGPVELEVSQIGKACHEDGCAIFRAVGKCVMPTDGIFCRVIQGGTAKPGDRIIHKPKLLKLRVFTLSDRVNEGDYEDESGPRIQDRLETFFAETRWRPEIVRYVIPDDANLLRDELEKARREGVDIVFTTGGTGVGPKDFTPDVVLAMADKTIPGIMEFIRLKYGSKYPNALLSRSVAGVLGTMLVYTLPGSLKAVDEYIDEIVKTMEHTVLMIRGLGH